jgi:hypothetical protein
MSNRVRRSNFSYRTQGTKIRIFPTPTFDQSGNTSTKKLWIRVGFGSDPFDPAYNDSTISGVAGPSNIPFDWIAYKTINSMGRQWIYEYCLACSTELLGIIRSKFGSVPIPGGDLQLDGSALLQKGTGTKEKLKADMKELLTDLTYDKMLEGEATKADNLQKVLKTIPMPMGKCIIIG